MPFVLDASVAVNWALDDEQHATALAARDRLNHDSAVVPCLWWYEIRNSLLINERRKRLAPGGTEDFLRILKPLFIEIDEMSLEVDLTGVARRHQLTIYDSAYLELAHRRRLPLATLDRALSSAARSIGVVLLESSMH